MARPARKAAPPPIRPVTRTTWSGDSSAYSSHMSQRYHSAGDSRYPAAARSKERTEIVPERSRPNFLLFITDQHRADFLGCYGHPVLRTPHIDSIAARGTAF